MTEPQLLLKVIGTHIYYYQKIVLGHLTSYRSEFMNCCGLRNDTDYGHKLYY